MSQLVLTTNSGWFFGGFFVVVFLFVALFFVVVVVLPLKNSFNEQQHGTLEDQECCNIITSSNCLKECLVT